MEFKVNMEYKYTERDFPEDGDLENGNYLRDCIVCGNIFMGHKRRVMCKICELECMQKLGVNT